MENIQIFEHPEFGSVRTIEVDGEPYFVGKDVALALGYANIQLGKDEEEQLVKAIDKFNVGGEVKS